MKGLCAFKDEHQPGKSIVVCNEREPRLSGDIRILPWLLFLEELWSGMICLTDLNENIVPARWVFHWSV